MKSFLIVLIFSCIGCGSPYEATSTYSGSYDDPKYGTFTTTLEFNDESIELQHSADGVARAASLAVNGFVEKELEGYERISEVLPCVQSSVVRVTSVETYFDYCPESSIACNKNGSEGAIYLKNGSGYSCLNDYTIGHEFLHDVVRCLGLPGAFDHSEPGVFAWNDSPIRKWDDWSVEHWISEQPDAKCEDNNL